MKYMVKVTKIQTVQVETEADSIMEAMKDVELNILLAQFKNLKWKDKQLYATDAERIEST